MSQDVSSYEASFAMYVAELDRPILEDCSDPDDMTHFMEASRAKVSRINEMEVGLKKLVKTLGLGRTEIRKVARSFGLGSQISGQIAREFRPKPRRG